MGQLQRLVVDPSQIQDQRVFLTSEQEHYLYRVLRLRSGDRVIVMDGQGQSWLTELVEESAQLQAEILEPIVNPSELAIEVTLVMALPKGSGFDEVVRQATELGVTSIAPVISDRTLLNPSPQKLERWRRIAQEAAEQSEREIVPTVLEPVSFAKHLKEIKEISDRTSAKFICVTRRNAPHLLTLLSDKSSLSPIPYPLSPLLIAIGPEGGWTDTEVENAIATGYQPVSLGSRILRAVTAPIVALSLIGAVSDC